MGKINDLLIEATEYRITEICCDWDEAWNWSMNQSLGDLLKYVEKKRQKPELIIDDAIKCYESPDDPNKYEKIAYDI